MGRAGSRPAATVTRLTRQELHAAVWRRPVRLLARTWGINQQTLHHICQRFDIPRPPAGHWRMRDPAKRTLPTPLPDPDDRREITIRASPAQEELRNSRVHFAQALKSRRPAAATDPIVQRTLDALNQAVPGPDGLVRSAGQGLVRVAVRPQSVERVAEILGELASAALQFKIELVETLEEAVWKCGDEVIGFELVEERDRVRYVPSQGELDAIASWTRECAEWQAKYGSFPDGPAPYIAKSERQYKGRIVVRLEKMRIPQERAIRRSFPVLARGGVERHLPRIFATIAAMAAFKRSVREE